MKLYPKDDMSPCFVRGRRSNSFHPIFKGTVASPKKTKRLWKGDLGGCPCYPSGPWVTKEHKPCIEWGCSQESGFPSSAPWDVDKVVGGGSVGSQGSVPAGEKDSEGIAAPIRPGTSLCSRPEDVGGEGSDFRADLKPLQPCDLSTTLSSEAGGPHSSGH